MGNSKCPTCGRRLGPAGACVACGGSDEKKTGSLQALMITGVVIGLLGAVGFGASKIVGNPFQILNRFKLRQTGIYEVTQAAKDLPVSREPNKTLKPDQIEHLRELFEKRQFATLNAKIEACRQDFEDDFNNEYVLQDAFSVFDTTLPDYEELFDAWIEYTPDHFAPYLARAHYFHTKGWESRGYGWSSDTTQEQFRRMHQNFHKKDFANALKDLKRSCELIGAALPYRQQAAEKFVRLKTRLKAYGMQFGKTVFREGTLILRPRGQHQLSAGGNGIALLGEAGGWISPSSAEGLSYAFESALMLAEALQSSPDGFEKRYDKTTRQLRKKLFLKNIKSHFIFKPLLRNLVMNSGLQSMTLGRH